MSFDTTEYWRQKISRYKNEKWAQDPSIFVQEVVSYLANSGSVLELGCGLGNDGAWLKKQGFEVTQSDLADFRGEIAEDIPFIEYDLKKPLQLNQSFDVIYSHLGLHYFTHERTKHLFKEIYNNLNPNGVFAFIVNSVEDPEFGIGNRIEDNYYDIEGQLKRYFDIPKTMRLCQDYEILLLDNEGSTHKDMTKNVHNLVRVVCKKK